MRLRRTLACLGSSPRVACALCPLSPRNSSEESVGRPGSAVAKGANVRRARTADASRSSRSGQESKCALFAMQSTPMICNSDMTCWQNLIHEPRSITIAPDTPHTMLAGDFAMLLTTRSLKLVKSSSISARYLLCICSMYMSSDEIILDLTWMVLPESPNFCPLARIRLCSSISCIQ